MTLLEAMQYRSVVVATKAYQKLGISVIPLKGKKASINWQAYSERIAAIPLIHNWHNVGLLQNVGIVCGAVSGNLVVLDLDGLDAVADFEQTFPQYLNTLTVLTGSGKGKHYYYYTKNLNPTVRTKGYELRSNGCYVVAPPSLHPDTTNLYQLQKEKDCQACFFEDLLPLERWIREKVMHEKFAVTISSQEGLRHATRYAKVALDEESHKVASAVQGNANNTLYISALKMGKYVENGTISRVEVEQKLLQSAQSLSARDTEIASWRTIQSGLNTGIQKARG